MKTDTTSPTEVRVRIEDIVSRARLATPITAGKDILRQVHDDMDREFGPCLRRK